MDIRLGKADTTLILEGTHICRWHWIFLWEAGKECLFNSFSATGVHNFIAQSRNETFCSVVSLEREQALEVTTLSTVSVLPTMYLFDLLPQV